MEYEIADLKNVLNGIHWSITARVLKKSDVLPFKNGNGKYFTTILMDKTTEIKATAFGDYVDHFFSQLQENNVYNIKNGEIKKADKAYNKSNNDYEIIFNGSTIIERSVVTDIPSHPSLKTIENVLSMATNTLIDTIGVIIKKEQSQEIKKKNSNDTCKLRNIILADSTRSVTVTLWGTEATNFNAHEEDIMSIIGGKITDYKSVKKISVTGSSKIQINPYWNETLDLRIWYKEFEKKKLLNLSQVSIGSQELNMFEISQSNRNKTMNEHILQQNKIDDDLISKRLLELNDEEHKIKTERTDLIFKKQRLSIERENIKSNLEN
ncbi:replication protein A 70 kDa DNA-binding subunit-like isoform X3 [Metopolophium dirhodum]|nr:replication protein A 70 kDa DNA-binding subunit-like isoform X3 [Metopolophium dirhodum]XP_060873166.1 replication protein A 70 kDa DNA-binding subunit-like isoform X3 [Metopolophium dirhodum]XP_060873167.1 replication protein A 70 kDa DNA-binding subunit-like isoform X3 [Metopolophium dirhodum]XP_060873168.1 replication protein A 70 kDa DNA-binding subunit-like isoform X3 [Metopolophium dirhodum]XP_060873169.1 replication protein A 70 kDa DNA-binding subunit-like isoform X3 [Metopolophium 